MDISQIKTFLAVVQTGSFVGAADVVHVTQSTVSVRMRTLEDELGVHLFARGKKGAVPTEAGRKFVRAASNMVRLWEQAKHEAGAKHSANTNLRIGGQVSLWQGYLTHWLSWMQREQPDIRLTASMSDPLSLIGQLVDGALDVVVLYRPQYRPGFRAEKIFSEEVILVSSLPEGADPFGDNYMLTYWGPDFEQDHALNFPNVPKPSLSTDLGTIAIDYLLLHPAAAFFPRRVAAPYIEAGRLHHIGTVSSFRYSAYGVLPEGLNPELAEATMRGLRETAAAQGLV